MNKTILTTSINLTSIAKMEPRNVGMMCEDEGFLLEVLGIDKEFPFKSGGKELLPDRIIH